MKRDLRGWKRLALFLGGALALALVVITMADVVPRPVSISVYVPESPRSGLLVRTTVSAEGETVAEVQEVARGEGGDTMEYRFWLPPGPHVIDVRGRGCTPTSREFDPAESARIHVIYQCDVGGVQSR